MTTDHLFPVLASDRDSSLLAEFASVMARGEMFRKRFLSGPDGPDRSRQRSPKNRCSGLGIVSLHIDHTGRNNHDPFPTRISKEELMAHARIKATHLCGTRRVPSERRRRIDHGSPRSER